jgi:drug/metabolite transporter (DMT)-like permease
MYNMKIYTIYMDWIYSIFIATIFFIAGQLCLRKSFELSNTVLHTFILFTMTIGIMSFPFLFKDGLQKKQNYIFPILAGIFFYAGNYFWINTINTKQSLGLIRIAMAGFETMLLFIVSYLFFADKITLLQFIGSLFILTGIAIATYN